MFNSNEKLFLSKHTCDQATFCYKRGEDWPLSLEFHVGAQKAEELKKHIENITPLAIEVERGNKQYRYVIEEVHSCKIGENVLQIEFSGEVFKNSEQFIDQHRDSFTMTIPDCTYILPRLPQSKSKPSPAVKPSQDTQDKSNATGVNNILMCSINEYSFKNYKLNRPTIKFLDKVDEYIQLISANKESENLIANIKEVRTSIASELDNLPKYPDKLEADEREIIKDYLRYIGKYSEFTSKILEKFGKLDAEDKETGEYLVVKMLKKFERNKDEIQASKEQKPVPEEAPSPATPQDLQAELNANKVSDINSILMCSKDKYSFENYKSKGSTIEFSQAAVEEYVKFISENENSKKLIEEIKKLREWVAFAQVENTQKFIDEDNEIGVIKDYLLYIQEYFVFTSNVLSDLNALSEKEKSEGGDRLVEGQLKRIEKILKKNAQSQNERLQRRVHFEDDVKNYQEETPVSHAKQPERKIDKSLSSGEGQIPHPHTDPHEPQASAFDNTSMYYAFGATCIGFLAIGVILCAVGMPEVGGIFIAGAVMCALIVGIGKVYEQVSREKQKDPEMSTYAAVKTIFKNIFASGHQKNNNLEPAER